MPERPKRQWGKKPPDAPANNEPVTDIEEYRQSSGGSERVPPHSIDLEMQVLGAMLLSGQAADKAASIVDRQSFYRNRHREVFDAIMALKKQNTPADISLVVDELERRGVLEECGGAAYIGDIARAVGTSVNVEYHARQLLEKSIRRKTIALATQAITDMYESSDEAHTIVEAMNSQLLQLAKMKDSRIVQIGNNIDAAWREIQLHAKGEHAGIPTGWPQLDKWLHLRNGTLNIIAAYTGNGKSAWLSQLALNAARRGDAVGIFSLEMGVIEHQQRMMKQLSREKVPFGKHDTVNWDKLKEAKKRLAELPIYMDDSPDVGPLQIRARASKMYAEHKIKLLIIDYAQLITVSEAENRNLAVTEVVKALKQLARELNIPVVAASQLKRTMTSNEYPTLDKLRESGAIEHTSDSVFFLWRPKPKDDTTRFSFIIAKQRHGVSDRSDDMLWQPEILKFTMCEDLAKANQAAAAGEPPPPEEAPPEEDEEYDERPW